MSEAALRENRRRYELGNKVEIRSTSRDLPVQLSLGTFWQEPVCLTAICFVFSR